jgi:hypothetical protein
VQLLVALGLGELLGESLALAALVAGVLGLPVAKAADGLGVARPAAQLAEEPLRLAERVVEAGQAGQPRGVGGEPAFQA